VAFVICKLLCFGLTIAFLCRVVTCMGSAQVRSFFKKWHSHFGGIKTRRTKVLGRWQWSLSIRLGKAKGNECFPEEDGTWWERENEARGT
jgi:hypothetical protein